MSYNENPELLSRNWLPWFPDQRNLIYLVKKYPITYHPSPVRSNSKEDKTKWHNAWIEIGKQLCQPSPTCKKLWTEIKLRYAKIMILIDTGKITKEAAMSNLETGRFFDGLLSFMDPFISKITEEDIPFRIHKSINDIFCLKTIRTQHVSSNESYTQFVTHAQVKALLRQRQSNEEQNLDITEPQYLQVVIDTAIKSKLEELLQKNDDLSNPSNDYVNTINGLMTPSNLRNVRKSKPHFTLVPSKNVLNNDKEKTTRTVNLGLETELIIEDDIKREAEDDNIKMEDDNDIKEKNTMLVMNINNTPDEIVYDLENILPSTQIVIPAAHDTIKNTISKHIRDDIAMTDNNEPPVSDDYIRSFFNELGEVMSLELSVSKQKTLKSRINKLLKDILLKEQG